jgi:1-acyl-sn-glycerol-3-phosphate acyltransferase
MRRLLGYVAIIWGALLMRLKRPAQGPEFFAARQAWGVSIARGFNWRFTHNGPLPSAGSLIIANHSGFADLNALMTLVPPEARPRYISKIEIGNIPIFGWHMRQYGDILFDRKDPEARRRVVDESLARLLAGDSVVLFPEGTRSRTGLPSRTIRPALLQAAIDAGVLVHPVAITGTANLVEQPGLLIRSTPDIRLRFGEPRRDFASAEAAWNAVLALWGELSEGQPTP